MNTIMSRMKSYLRNISGRGITERALDDELEAYAALVAAEKRAQGMNEAAAMRAARQELGMESVKEQVREARSGYYSAALLQDIRYTVRMLVKSPAYTLAIVMTLALGIGATTAIFTVVRAVLLRDLPYEEPERIVRVWPTNPSKSIELGATSFPEFADWRAEQRVFSSVAAYSASLTGVALTGVGEPARLNTAYVTEDFFATMGTRALHGRTITPDEHVDGANQVVVLSHDLWQSRFGADPRAIGRTVTLNERPFTVVGVMSRSMRFPASNTEVWVPLTTISESGSPRVRSNRWLQMVGRLQPGVSTDDAQQQLAGLTNRLASDYADTNSGWSGVRVVPLSEDIIGAARGRLLVIFGTVMLILLLGCVNIANLVLARATQRQREVAIRAAVGASRSRLVRQLLTESLVLSFAGGAAGVALAWAGSAALSSMASAWLPLPEVVRPDWMVLSFAFIICIATGTAFALIPASASFSGLSGTLRDSGRSNSPTARAHSMRRAFVALEVALAVVLVAGAALFVESFSRLSRVELGYDTEHTAFARLVLPKPADGTIVDRVALGEEMVASVRTMPGVLAAGIITKHPPLRGVGETLRLKRVGETYAPGTEPIASTLSVSGGLFDAMQMRIIEGRDLTPRDNETNAVVVSESVARTMWGERSAVGQQLIIEEEGPFPVVGVVSDIRFNTIDGAATPMIYPSRSIMSRSAIAIVARGTGDPAQLLASIREGVQAVDPDLAFTELATMQSVVDEAIAAPRFLSWLLTMFGILAILLAAIGVYGVVSYVVGQRRNEIGIRMALGARTSGIVMWTLRTGMAPVIVGLVAGVACAALLSRVISAQLFEVSTGNVATYIAVAGLLGAISLAATGIPALRATRVDPTVALRAD